MTVNLKPMNPEAIQNLVLPKKVFQHWYHIYIFSHSPFTSTEAKFTQFMISQGDSEAYFITFKSLSESDLGLIKEAIIRLVLRAFANSYFKDQYIDILIMRSNTCFINEVFSAIVHNVAKVCAYITLHLRKIFPINAIKIEGSITKNNNLDREDLEVINIFDSIFRKTLEYFSKKLNEFAIKITRPEQEDKKANTEEGFV